MAATEPTTSEDLLMGILAVLITEREERENPTSDHRKTELILDAAGVGVNAIAQLMDKKPDAVRKTIQRARS